MAHHARALARQARSRQTEQKILAAAVELMSEHEARDLSIAAIAGRAGVSVGGFYARFASKDALFEHLYAGVLGGIVEDASERLASHATRGVGARAIVEDYIALGVRAFREHRTIIRQISLRNRTSNDSGFKRRIQDFNETLHDLFRERLYERPEQMAHHDPKRGIDIALTSVSAAMREYVLFQDLRPQYAALEDETLVAELTDLACTYLRIES